MMMVVNFDDTPGDDDDGQDGDCDVGFWLSFFSSTLAWLKEDYEDVKYDIRIL